MIPASPAAAEEKRLPIGERLVQSGRITRAQLQMALSEHQRTREPIGKVLISLGLVTQDQLNALVFEDAHIERVQLRERRIDRTLVDGVDLQQLREWTAVPISREGDCWTIAVADPSDILVADALSGIFQGSRHIVGATRSEILETLRDLAAQPDGAGAPTDSTNDAIVSLNNIMSEALARRATDIHIEPEEKLTRVRYRVDGVLVAGPTYSINAANSIVSRLKIVSSLDISIKRMPQDGRYRYNGNSGAIDCRVSTIPTIHGENAVVRLLDGSHGTPRLAELQFGPEIESTLRAAAAKPHGIVYVVGATGSGKTTTLYALLGSIDAMQRKVCTVEDPVEYRLPLARQTQVQPEIGFDFATALRSLLRQDPDVVLVGETRDSETAQIGLRAALTGHLVFSTLHANRAAGGAARLIEMGVDSCLLASSLTGILAQTLVRRVCGYCKESKRPGPDAIGFFTSQQISAPAEIVYGAGCERCNFMGYLGRRAVAELLIPNRQIAAAIQSKASAVEIYELALANGLVPIERVAAAHAADGATTVEEAARVSGYALGGNS
ncbi:MAG: Flp pilus assembly complex ATPase component TadA [Planctomycetes bacterium]|nr:Flp pilus assembly complex ATPase component TadA [Planctomycetota bacterium]